MTNGGRTPQDRLNGYVDGRLSADETRKMRALIDEDDALAEEVRRLREINNLAAEAYRDIPEPRQVRRDPTAARRWRRAAALALLAIGVAAGYQWHTAPVRPNTPSIETLEQVDPAALHAHKILLHISTMDPKRVEPALDAVQRILAADRRRGRAVRIEVVANQSGLGILRVGSPYAARIRRLQATYGNVSFKACGIAMETARLKEGTRVRLLPQAQQVDAALEEILRRLKEGWTYIRA